MERQYKIMWKDDFVIYLKDSPYFMADKGSKTDRQVNTADLFQILRGTKKDSLLGHTEHAESKGEAQLLLEPDATRIEAQFQAEYPISKPIVCIETECCKEIEGRNIS